MGQRTKRTDVKKKQKKKPKTEKRQTGQNSNLKSETLSCKSYQWRCDQHRMQTCNLLQFYYPSCNRPSEAEVIKTINMLKNANGGLLTKNKRSINISLC